MEEITQNSWENLKNIQILCFGRKKLSNKFYSLFKKIPILNMSEASLILSNLVIENAY